MWRSTMYSNDYFYKTYLQFQNDLRFRYRNKSTMPVVGPGDCLGPTNPDSYSYSHTLPVLSIALFVTKTFFFEDLGCESESRSVVSNSLWPHGLYSLWNSPGQNTGVGSLSLLQQIFPTQGSNAGLLHCRWILYQLSHKGRPRILEWVAYPFSCRSS